MREEFQEIQPPLSPRESVIETLLKRWLKQGWERNDSELVDDHFHPECIIIGMAPEVIEGIDELRTVHRAICGRLNHRQANVQSILIRGNHFATTMEFEGRHLETDIDVAFEVACFGVMKDGLIYRAHNTVDYTGLYAKMGILDVNQLASFFG